MADVDNGSYHDEQQSFDAGPIDWHRHSKSDPPESDFDIGSSFNIFTFDNVDSNMADQSMQSPTTSGQTLTASIPTPCMTTDTFPPWSFNLHPSTAAQYGGYDGVERLAGGDPSFESRDLHAFSHGRTDLPSTSTCVRTNSPPASDEDVIGVNSIHSTTAVCVQQLAELSARLYDHAGTVPSHEVFKDATEGTPSNRTSNKNNVGSKDFCFDDTYQLTQNLVDLYPTVLNTTVYNKPHGPPWLPKHRQQHRPDSSPLQISHDMSWPGDAMTEDIQHQAQLALPQYPILDNASILLVLSCHHRLLDVWEAIFDLMQACIEHSTVPRNHDGQPMTIGTLKIGSFVPSTAAAVPMHMSLIGQFASQLFERICELISKVAAVVARTKEYGNELVNKPDEVGVFATDLACKAVMARTSKMVHQVERLQCQILPSAIRA